MAQQFSTSVELRGGWAFERGAADSLAANLSADQVVHLTGELHQALWHRPQQLLRWSSVLPDLRDLVEAFQQPSTLLTVLDFVRGDGFGQLFVELTGRCNERCVHCYASSSPEVTSQLDLAQVLNVVEDGAQLGFTTILFTGGDPLLSLWLLPAVQRAQELGYPNIEIYTNGLALRPELAQALAQHGARFAFSMYSHRAAVHDAITQTPDSWERTRRAVQWALDTGAVVRVHATLREENADDLAPLRQLLQGMGVAPERIRADRERPVGRGHWDDRTQLDYGLSTEMHQTTPASSRRGKLAVTYDGNIVPCLFDRQVLLGSICHGMGLRAALARPVRSFRRGFPLVPARGLQLQVVGQPLACGSCQARHPILDGLEFD